jgi:hypothetical protein
LVEEVEVHGIHVPQEEEEEEKECIVCTSCCVLECEMR